MPATAPTHSASKTTSDEDVILEVTDLKKYFPIHKGVFSRLVGHVKAVDDVSFTVERGEETLDLKLTQYPRKTRDANPLGGWIWVFSD